MITSRETKYSKQLEASIGSLGHATNAQLLDSLRTIYPDVSATTVHRATARLLEKGRVSEAPVDSHGAMRYDTTTKPHDHFICNGCHGIRDIDIAQDVTPTISKALGGCKITGRLIIHGTCERCLTRKATA